MKELTVKQERRIFALVLAAATTVTGTAQAIEPIDESYVSSLAAPGKIVLVMEYSDAAGEVVNRKGYASAEDFSAISGTSFRIDGNTTINLYGVEPCDGEMVNMNEGFSGSCADWALQGITEQLGSAKVAYCRSFVSEQNATNQDASCYIYVYYPGALNGVFNLEEQLVSTGFLRISKDAAGKPLRPDLADSESIGRKGYGMWADSRIKAQ